MDGKIDVKLLWQILMAVTQCNSYDYCDDCLKDLGCEHISVGDDCPKSSPKHIENTKIVADAIKKYLLDHLPDKTEVPLEEVIDLLKTMS